MEMLLQRKETITGAFFNKQMENQVTVTRSPPRDDIILAPSLFQCVQGIAEKKRKNMNKSKIS